MALKDLIPQPKTLTLKTGSLTLHPLTLEDIIIILQSGHEKEMTEMMEGKVSIPALLKDAPVFACKLVALSAQEPDEWATVRKLPFAVQLAALETVWDLSSVEGDMLGKLVLRIAEGLDGLNAILKQRNESKKPASEG